jgi:hypothetical protein
LIFIAFLKEKLFKKFIMRNLLIACTILIFSACKFENENKQHTPKAIEPEKKIENLTCIPGEKVGLIAKNFTEEDIIKAYGKENVKREEISLGEGEMSMATAVFPNSNKTIFVSWKIGKEFKEIAEVLIENENSPWKTAQGIGIGTNLAELVKINGKNFQFAGFEWDYSGIVTSWDGGSISDKLNLFLEPGNPEAIYPDLLGDALFPSDHPKTKGADLKVRTMIIKFE